MNFASKESFEDFMMKQARVYAALVESAYGLPEAEKSPTPWYRAEFEPEQFENLEGGHKMMTSPTIVMFERKTWLFSGKHVSFWCKK